MSLLKEFRFIMFEYCCYVHSITEFWTSNIWIVYHCCNYLFAGGSA